MTDDLDNLKTALNSMLDRWQQLQDAFDAAPESDNPELRNEISSLSADIKSLDGKIAQIIREQNK